MRLRHRSAVLTVVALAGTAAFAAARPEAAAPVVSYRIDARLDPAARAVHGRERLRWHNATRQPANDLYFHLYLNAFANNRTLFLSAEPERTERWMKRHPEAWGGIDVQRISIGNADVTKKLEIVPPEDGNPHDHTVARLPLDAPVAGGAILEVEIEFVARLPRVYMRAGHAAPFFMVAQWFPKIGVFEDGRWRCRHYHFNTEFFADFGRYEVELTVPGDFVVGYTGVAESERGNPDGTRTIRVRADDVHDFAWAADPRFRVFEDRIDDVPVRFLMQPPHVRQLDRYRKALRAAVSRYHDWFGRYPYPALTVVDPGPGARNAGGMEYPMLITVGTTWGLPDGVRIPEMVTIHEFGHQYWYGVVANDETEEAWLDEGINSYVEGRIMDEVYGAQASYLDFLGLRLNAIALQRLGYLRAPYEEPLTRAGGEMLDRTAYTSATYSKTALVLESLSRQVGPERFRRALGEYFRRWRFRHPTGQDWRDAVEKSLGAPLDDFFAQTLDGTGVLDYAVKRVEVREVAALVGAGTAKEPALPEVGARRYRSEIVVERRGEVRMPVEIVVGFEDGSTTRESWDGRERWRRLEITSAQRAEYAVVDPEEKLPLDVNRINNSRMRAAGTRGVVRLAARWGMWLQNALHFLTGF